MNGGKEKEKRSADDLNGQKPYHSRVCAVSDKKGQRFAAHGKAVDKKFFHVEKCVENVTKPRKTVIFRAFRAENDGF